MGRKIGFLAAVVGASTAVATLLLVNSAVAAASGWSSEHLPKLPAGINGDLAAVSCTSVNACTAVGDYYNNRDPYAAHGTLAERWNGTKWSIQPTPNPTGGADLWGVSCTSASACTAVGYRGDGGMLAERWNGTNWKVQRTPWPAGPTGRPLFGKVSGVSCASANACTAVGWIYLDGRMVAERWNGAKWRLERAPKPPPGMGEYQVYGVSCASATACTAVGQGPGGLTLAVRWNGTKWSIQPTPNPSGAADSFVNGVSCASARDCMAVGYNEEQTGTNLDALAEHWNGAKWSMVPIPNASGESQSSLFGVSCASASACTAVGGAGFPGSMTLAERWNATMWSVQHTPSSDGAGNSVSCASKTACTAVGGYSAERWTR